MACATKNSESVTIPIVELTQAAKDSIAESLFKSDVIKDHGIFSTEWQDLLDDALAKDPSNAYLWQQKSMPLYKQGKYQLGRPALDNAARCKPEEYMQYRAFMICIFEKNYIEAIEAFEECIDKYGVSYVMDHSYTFYIAISKIQLNKFEEAEQLLVEEIASQKKTFGETNAHFLDYFYLGIARYEMNKYDEAIEAFDDAISGYPSFADAQIYKAKSLYKLGKEEEAQDLYKIANENGKEGHTINEDNAAYERYPYQVRW